jgi:hypothetical protein
VRSNRPGGLFWYASVCNFEWGRRLNAGPSGGVLTFQELGSLGEFVAAIATLITLVYLAFQIKQNTKISRAQLTKDLFLASRSALLEIARDEDLARIAAESYVSTVDAKAIGPTEIDAVRRAEFFNSFFRLFELNFNLERQDLLDEPIAKSYDLVVRLFVKSDSFVEWWTRARETEYLGEFATRIDTIIAEVRGDT